MISSAFSQITLKVPLDPDNAFFADGMHDEVITSLAKIHDLTVLSRTSVLAYKKAEGRNLKKIAAELGVGSVLEGSVQRAGNRVKISVTLINAHTNAHLWGETYTKDLTDAFAIQSELAREIAAALKATLTAAERALIERRLTQNQAAYDLYLRARVQEESLTNRSSREQFDQVIGLYEQSAAQDPSFMLPHVRLSVLSSLMYFLGNIDPTPERREVARAGMEAARSLAPAAPETRLAQGAFAYHCDNDFVRAMAEFRAAEAGLPNDASLFALTGYVLRRLGRWREAVDAMERSITLNHRDLFVGTLLMTTTFQLRRMPRVLELARRYQALFPSDGFVQKSIIQTRYALDGDRAAYIRARAAAPLLDDDPEGLVAAYENALIAGDLGAAAHVLDASRLGTVIITEGDRAVNNPVALHRAQVAFLRGQPEVAARAADDAIAFFRSKNWTPRQGPFVAMGIARAEVYAGRAREGTRDAKAALAQVAGRDAFSEMVLRVEIARIDAALERREEALAGLRELLTGPCTLSPNEIRIEPFLSRLADDPRFEEILKAAKAL